uniref:Uncharacterized protein n=1 Tax=Arundo donax TaxID=35708 RepID=A0A0A9HS31_ARUDO
MASPHLTVVTSPLSLCTPQLGRGPIFL